MPSSPVLLPDVLGFLTGGPRAGVGAIQAACAIRPKQAPIGKPFEALLLLQNAADTAAEVTITLHLPKGFEAPKSKIVVGVNPGEVGFVSLPLMARDLAPGSAHKLGVELEAKSSGKPGRVRENEGGPAFNPAVLPPDRQKGLAAIKGLSFSAAKRMGRAVLDVPVTLAAPDPSAPVREVKPGWFSLWSLADVEDERFLMNRYGEALRFKILPGLKHERTLMPLVEATRNRFEAAGFPLDYFEALMIGKLMALLLEYALPKEFGHDPLVSGKFNLYPLLTGAGGEFRHAPRWFRGLVKAIARDERAAGAAIGLLQKPLYDLLLRDALDLGFILVEQHTGENVGDDKEMDDYASTLLQKLHGESGLSFIHVYMPLVMAGITVNEIIVTDDDNMIEALRQLWVVLDGRRELADENTLPVVELTEQVIERALETYGFRRGST